MDHFGIFSGIITLISDFWTGNEQMAGCYKLMSVVDKSGSIVNFVVTPFTYFVDHVMMTAGDAVVGFYDTTVPVPLIYPPQYQSIVIARASRYQNVTVDYFNSQLVSSDGTLKLNVSPFNQIIVMCRSLI